MQTELQGLRVFISGGAGVIGQELVPRLVAQGALVTIGDLKPRPAAFGPQVAYRQGDLNAMTAAEMQCCAPAVFIHLAATFERSTESYAFWEENFLHNVRLSHHLTTLVKDLPSLRRVVFASSYLIYDPALYQFDQPRAAAVSLKESDPVNPRNLTGMAKFAHEIELRFIDHFCSQRFSTVCARIYRGYGRRSRDVISRWVRALLQGEPISVYRPEGLFDYVYAADTAEGLLRLAAAPAVTGIINLGSGQARRVQDVVDALRVHFPEMVARTADADIAWEASQADVTRLRAALGWVPSTPLEEAIGEIVAFERARPQAGTMAAPPLKVLVSSASRKVPLVRAMQAAVRQIDPQGQVVAGDLQAGALSAVVADDFWAMPPTRDEQLPALLQGLRARGIRCVLPTRDGELDFWARHAETLQREGIAVLVAPAAALGLCMDKLAFARFGAERGLPFIPAALHPDELGPGPYVVKERHGAGSRSLGLDLDREAALAHARGLQAPIFQPLVRGHEISIDGWLDRRGRCKGVVLRRRDRVVNGESEVTTTFGDAVLEARSVQILEALGLGGPVVMQAMIDAAGAMHVIECNARFGGASTTSLAVGLDSLHWSLRQALGEDLSALPFLRAPGQVRQVRLPTDLLIHDPDL
jgi:carbamoyl-phosphate synthase large subunit